MTASSTAAEEFLFALETRLPAAISVGKGNMLYIAGWCFHSGQAITRLEVAVDDYVYPVAAQGIVRPDIRQQMARQDPQGYSQHSGFWALIPFQSGRERAHAVLRLHATLEDGARIEQEIAQIGLERAEPEKGFSDLARTDATAQSPLVAICMATYNPPLHLFRRQIESLIRQTHQHWVCVISDDASNPEALAEAEKIIARDPRFMLSPAPERLGFYYNFERSLQLAPAAAEFITLCDQDDYWHPDKLSTLIAAFDPRTTLVYSDMRIVDEQGAEITPTYWTTRRNNHTNLAALLLANCVTGAASMFRRELMDYLLPFPQRIGDLYHDHWLGCLALAMGRIKYVPRALYDYVQHGGNVIGHCAPPREDVKQMVYQLVKHMATPYGRQHARDIYRNNVLKIEALARIILMRGGSDISWLKQRALRRVAKLEHSLPGLLWLTQRMLRTWRRVSVTVGAEKRILLGLLWRHYIKLKSKLEPKQVGAPAAAAEPQALNLDTADVLAQKIAPLKLAVSATAAPRVNLLIPSIDLRYVFGGYLTKFALARRLAQAGLRVRFVIVDYSDFNPALWRLQLRAYQDVEDLFEHVEVAYHFDRETPLTVSPRDTFIATTWWTAHIAHAVARQLRRNRFIYLIQEYEPFTFPMGSFAAVAAETYGFPHYAVFSTELLRDYFRQQQLGVFAEGRAPGERDSVSFDNPITNVGAVTAADLSGRDRHKLLFYARPEPHAARNMFELGLAALKAATATGAFDQSWEFYGIGSIEAAAAIELAGGRQLHLLPRQDQDKYRDILRAHDLGLCLMYTPHPSLVPVEMASAGMLTVTNTFANKTPEKLRRISSNIVAVAPTIADVARGLAECAARIDDHTARAQGAQLRWPVSSEQAFTPELIAAFKDFIARGSSAESAASR